MNSVTKDKLPSHAMGKERHTHSTTHRYFTSLCMAHSRDPDSIPGQSIQDLWWTRWHQERLSYKYFSLTLIHSPNTNAMSSQQLTVPLNTTIKTDTSLHNQQSPRSHFHGSYSHGIATGTPPSFINGARILENYG